MADPIKILVVDDEESILGFLKELLEGEGFEVITAVNAEEALRHLKAQPLNLVLTDIKMPDLTGMDLIEVIRALKPEAEVIIMTAHASLDTAIQAIQLGAYDYLIKPFEDIQHVMSVVKRAVERERLAAENRRLVEDLKQKNEELAQATKRAAILLTEAHTFSEKVMGLFSSENLEEVEQRTVEVLSHLMKGRPVVLFDYSMETQELVGCKASGMGQDVVAGLRVKLAWIPSASSGFEKRGYAPLLQDLFQRQLGSVILDVPVTSHSGKNGILVVSEGSQGPFSPKEKELADHFGLVAARAFELTTKEVPRKAVSFRDELTSFFSPSYFEEYLKQEITRSRRYRHPFSLCLLEIDGLENEDEEKVLKEIGERIRKRARTSDVVARSDERFLLLLPETNKEWGQQLVKSLRKRLDEYCESLQGSIRGGLAIVDYPRDADTPAGLMEQLENEIRQKEPVERPAASVSPTPSKEEAGRAEKKRILVVDDEKSIRDFLRETLAEAGYDVETAASAQEAWFAVTSENVDLILLDIRMPGLSGLDLLRVVRAKKLRVKVLIMTAHQNEEMAKNAIEMGAAGYLLKPFDDLEILMQQVNQVMR